MMRWVVTGPIGAGKSLFTSELARLGAGVVDGDQLGHEILERPEIIEAVAREFGTKYVLDGSVNRAALGRLVFGDPDQLAALDALTHAPLAALMEERLASLAADPSTSLAVLEAAVYFLLPSPPAADLVILVEAPPEVRRERLRRVGLTARQADARLTAQEGMLEPMRRARVRYENVGTPDDVFAFIDHLWNEYGPGRTQPKD